MSAYQKYREELDVELELLRELGEAAKYWLSIEEASVCVPVDRDSCQMAFSDLKSAIDEYCAWEQDL